MKAGKNKVRRIRAQLIMEWMAEFGFEDVEWRTLVEWNGKAYDVGRWDKVRHVETAKVVVEVNGGKYKLDRDKAVRYMEKYL